MCMNGEFGSLLPLSLCLRCRLLDAHLFSEGELSMMRHFEVRGFMIEPYD